MKIENPNCSVISGKLTAGFTKGEFRYHVWLNDKGTAIEGRQLLYKNPIKKDSTTRTQRLSAYAKVNQKMIAELLAAIDPAAAWAKNNQIEEEEQREAEKEKRQRQAKERLDKAAPELLELLKEIILVSKWSPTIKRAEDLIKTL